MELLLLDPETSNGRALKEAIDAPDGFDRGARLVCEYDETCAWHLSIRLGLFFTVHRLVWAWSRKCELVTAA